ncbi:GntR family transcriptional regulator [candidate division KSB1 bacterium]
MNLAIEHGRGLPIYLQIIEQIRHMIAIGALAAGDQLPTMRALAVTLAVNPNTVAKAYTELERSGVLETKQGVGTFVAHIEMNMDTGERMQKLNGLTVSFIDEALSYGFGPSEIVTAVQSAVREKRT